MCWHMYIFIQVGDAPAPATSSSETLNSPPPARHPTQPFFPLDYNDSSKTSAPSDQSSTSQNSTSDERGNVTGIAVAAAGVSEQIPPGRMGMQVQPPLKPPPGRVNPFEDPTSPAPPPLPPAMITNLAVVLGLSFP
ncbi:hypothetical protein KY285_004569 [Solanum tuberosum]|nr:hypothetical protein KY285_004569 [Solanum tuberosum]